MTKARLVLEDGGVYEGLSIGMPGRTLGEVVFNTSMTGYQEILTDPSYAGQIVALTYPLIGNYGMNEVDHESGRVQVAGFIVREMSVEPSNHLCTRAMQEFLISRGIVGIQGVDVRALTRKIRVHGVMLGAITTDETVAEALARIRSAPPYDSVDFVREVSTSRAYEWEDDAHYGTGQWTFHGLTARRIVALDYGVKFNILRSLRERDCSVVVLPCTASAADVLAMKPNGVLLSNGPGDPRRLDYTVETTRGLIGKVPLMGICLGHQILGRALGGEIFKLKFGHRGANHPVKDLTTGRVHITSQNHGYAVDADSIRDPNVEISHINLNDQTVEGLRYKCEPVFSVQYHPEASPGPRDNGYLFDRFVQMVDEYGQTAN